MCRNEICLRKSRDSTHTGTGFLVRSSVVALGWGRTDLLVNAGGAVLWTARDPAVSGAQDRSCIHTLCTGFAGTPLTVAGPQDPVREAACDRGIRLVGSVPERTAPKCSESCERRSLVCHRSRRGSERWGSPTERALPGRVPDTLQPNASDTLTECRRARQL